MRAPRGEPLQRQQNCASPPEPPYRTTHPPCGDLAPCLTVPSAAPGSGRWAWARVCERFAALRERQPERAAALLAALLARAALARPAVHQGAAVSAAGAEAVLLLYQGSAGLGAAGEGGCPDADLAGGQPSALCRCGACECGGEQALAP